MFETTPQTPTSNVLPGIKNEMVKTEGVKSQKKYNFTEADDQLAPSNTKYLFKNLYGETLLTSMFFSATNVKNIQTIVRFLVHKETGHVIDDQSTNELLIIMRSIFLEYSAHPKLPSDTMSDKELEALHKQYTNEVFRLNDITANTIVPKVISQMQQYLDYLRDINQLAYVRENPKNDSISGQREYRSPTQIWTGGSL
jgi:hypothetical protein